MTPKDFKAHVIQLCHYVEDCYTARDTPGLIDWGVVNGKAQSIMAIINKEEADNG